MPFLRVSHKYQRNMTDSEMRVQGGNKMKDKIFGVLQRVGRSFMLPIAIL